MAKEKNTKRSRESGTVVIWDEVWLTKSEEVTITNETA